MLTQVTVQGFKSLLDVRELALGQVNAFIGANGSGKSNLLEAKCIGTGRSHPAIG